MKGCAKLQVAPRKQQSGFGSAGAEDKIVWIEAGGDLSILVAVNIVLADADAAHGDKTSMAVGKQNHLPGAKMIDTVARAAIRRRRVRHERNAARGFAFGDTGTVVIAALVPVAQRVRITR